MKTGADKTEPDRVEVDKAEFIRMLDAAIEELDEAIARSGPYWKEPRWWRFWQ